MSSKLKVAILEDNQAQLKDRKDVLQSTGLVEVVAWATESTDFINKTHATKPDALLLDIDLGGDSMNGLEIAYQLKLPVLFVSGHNARNLKEIEELKRYFDLIVEHITKPFTEADFVKTITRFVKEVKSLEKEQYVYLDFNGARRNKIKVDAIVCIASEKSSGAESNNKVIYFLDRKPEVLIDFSFVDMEGMGFNKNVFVTIHKSFRVNSTHILRYVRETDEVEVKILSQKGELIIKKLPVSENYRKNLKK